MLDASIKSPTVVPSFEFTDDEDTNIPSRTTKKTFTRNIDEVALDFQKTISIEKSRLESQND